MAGNNNSGRRPSPPVDVTTLEELNLTQVIRLLRILGRPHSRPKLVGEILAGRLKVYINYGRLSNRRNPVTGQPEPTYVVLRKDLDAWRKATLTPLRVAELATRAS